MLCHCTRACGALLLLGLMAFSVGCSSSKARATVKGKVTFAGKSLTVGSVMFYGKDNVTASASIDKNGNYVMADAPLGEVKITVSVPRVSPEVLAKMKAMAGFKDVKSVNPENPGQSISIVGEMPSQPPVPIPEKYASVETSGLTYTVERGEHTHDITLTK